MRNELSFSLILLVSACGDDGVGNDDSTTGDTEPTSTSAPSTSSMSTSSASTSSTDGTSATTESSGSESGSGTSTGSGSESDSGSDSGSSSGSGSSTTASACTPVETTQVTGDGFSGWGACEGVMVNVVLDDIEAVEDHTTAYCDSLAACMDPDPECPPVPDLDLDGYRVVYAQGSTSGCSASAMISEVLDCGDTVEVHYIVAGVGPCGLVVYGWDAVVIPDGADVVFIED